MRRNPGVNYRDTEEKKETKKEDKKDKKREKDIFEGRNLKPLMYIYLCIIIFILIFVFVAYTFLSEFWFTIKTNFEVKNEKENFINTHISDFSKMGSEIIKYKFDDKKTCNDVYGNICKQNNGVSLFDIGTENSLKLIKKMNGAIRNFDVNHFKIADRNKRFSFIKLTQHHKENIDRMKDMNEFYVKCKEFHDSGYGKIKKIYENPLFKSLIHEIINYKDISEIFGLLSKNNIDVPIGIDLKPFVVDKEKYIIEELVSIEMSGIPLKYIKTSSIQKERRDLLKDVYKNVLSEIMSNIGVRHPEIVISDAKEINAFLNRNGLRKRRDKKEDKIIRKEDIKNIFKNFDFDNYINKSSITFYQYSKTININKVSFFELFDIGYKNIPDSKWKNYLLYNTIISFIKRSFDLIGDYENSDLKCLRITKEYYPISTCRIFKHFMENEPEYGNNEETISKITKIVEDLIDEFIKNIDNSFFCVKMKNNIERLKVKMKNIKIHVGKCAIMDRINKISYVKEDWINMVEKSEYSVNTTHKYMEIINEFNKKQIFRLERNDDFDIYYKDLTFFLTELNAWYDNYFNHIVIPPGFFVYPFYSKNFKPWELWSVLSGNNSIKIVICSHEIFHSFFFHLTNNLDLTSEESRCINERKNYFINLYNINKKHSDIDVKYGERTLNENMADFFGLQISYNNWFHKAQVNLTNIEERKKNFFIRYVQTWCKDSSYTYDTEDEHASLDNRGFIPLLSLNDEIYKVFNCDKIKS